MEGGIGYVVLGIAVVVVTVGCYLWVRQLRTTAQVRARSQDPADSFDEDLEQWLSQRLPARWLIDSAHSAAIATMRLEAIDFYNHLAEKWNDEMGWAERRLISTSLGQENSNRSRSPTHGWRSRDNR
jgi:hypothetical protein